MKYVVVVVFVVFSIFSLTSARPDPTNKDAVLKPESDSFGDKIEHAGEAIQAKRDLSLSYAATDIDSKEGTHVKTITVIKNIGKKPEKLNINPELHKNEEWANAFRDNFDSYGRIPDVPDIDDLFEFVKKKDKNKKDEEKPSSTSDVLSVPATSPKTLLQETTEPSKEIEKPVVEASSEFEGDSAVVNDSPVEKIKGDAELISSNKQEQNSARSQSLAVATHKSRIREPLVNVNYSTPQHSVHQYFENYVQENSKGYDYEKPCVNTPISSISISTASGRKYDIPVNKNAVGSAVQPYIAPAIVKKTQVFPQDTTQTASGVPNHINYPVNSLVPPLQPNAGQLSSTTIRPSIPIPIPSSTSQRPYVAPNLLNNLSTNRVLTTTPLYNSGPTNFRTNIFGLGTNRPNTARSRGLKY